MATARSTTSTGTRKGATATATRKGTARKQAEDAYEEVKGGADFPATWDFEEQGDLIGTFTGTVVKEIKGKDRTIHSFIVDGEDVTAWGAAILDSRLSDLTAPIDVKVIKTGDKVATKAGRGAWEFKVYAKRSALHKPR